MTQFVGSYSYSYGAGNQPNRAIDFYSTGREVFGVLFRGARNQWNDTGIRVRERSMSIETENLSGLLRGFPQKTLQLEGLSMTQKLAIIQSLSGRSIQIGNSLQREASDLTISALA